MTQEFDPKKSYLSVKAHEKMIAYTKDDKDLKDNLSQRFNSLTEDSLKPFLGEEMEKIVKVSLDSLKQMQTWYIEEVNVYFSKIDDRENVLIEDRLIPALASSLSFSFEPVEWWPADKPVKEPDEASLMGQLSLKAIFRKWFKGH
jgi:hypothetical protein